LLLVGAVLGLGALNWKRLTPKLGEAGGNDALRRAATTELLLAQVVLLVTAILVRMSPMDH
jgi:putative copper export protein